MGVYTYPVAGSATVLPWKENELIVPPSWNVFARKLLVATPGSAGWKLMPSSLQPKARPPGPPPAAPHPEHSHERYRIGLPPSALFWGAVVELSTPSNGRSAVTPGAVAQFEVSAPPEPAIFADPTSARASWSVRYRSLVLRSMTPRESPPPLAAQIQCPLDGPIIG